MIRKRRFAEDNFPKCRSGHGTDLFHYIFEPKTIRGHSEILYDSVSNEGKRSGILSLLFLILGAGWRFLFQTPLTLLLEARVE